MELFSRSWIQVRFCGAFHPVLGTPDNASSRNALTADVEWQPIAHFAPNQTWKGYNDPTERPSSTIGTMRTVDARSHFAPGSLRFKIQLPSNETLLEALH